MVAGTDATDKPVLDTEELAKNIWDRPWSTERRNDWLQWISLASECDVPMMKNAAKTIKKRLYGILMQCVIASRMEMEALNSKIRLLRIKPGIPKPGTL